MEVQKSEGREKVAEKIFEEMMAKNILHLMKNFKRHILEVQWTPSRISSSRHIVAKLESQKKKILKTFREVTYFVHGILNKINSWFLRRNHSGLKAVRWHTLIAGNDCQPKILYPAKLSFRNKGERCSQIREFVAVRFALQKALKGLLQSERKRPSVIKIHTKKQDDW